MADSQNKDRADTVQPRQDSSIRKQDGGAGASERTDANDTQDAATELSGRGGIRPERDDPATYTDRSRPRSGRESAG
ncbi:MAG TPA: hypothetical protein VK929_00310 [Longimicrobiales bacterium]|nr:hypothetical protein [Longimicrobiales bacterium]